MWNDYRDAVSSRATTRVCAMRGGRTVWPVSPPRDRRRARALGSQPRALRDGGEGAVARGDDLEVVCDRDGGRYAVARHIARHIFRRDPCGSLRTAADRLPARPGKFPAPAAVRAPGVR